MKLIELGTWKNKKTGDLYEVTGTRINSTNDRNGEIMVEYQREVSLDNHNRFIREINEFQQKFEKVSND